MKKLFAILSVLSLTHGVTAYADSSAATTAVSATSTPTGSTSSPKAKHKKKATPQPTPAATTPVPTPAAAPKRMSEVSNLFSSNIRLYDRLGAPGDVRQAVSLAAKSSVSSKRDRSVFLWLGRVVGGDMGRTSYIHFEINGLELGGPQKPWVVLTGTVDDQSGSSAKAGDPIEVAVDFRDVKVDYEGTKLGEIQKGNDIADQFYELMATHGSYEWVLLAQDRLRDSDDPSGIPTFVAKAREGYAFLEPMESHR